MERVEWAKSIKDNEFVVMIAKHGDDLPSREEMHGVASIAIRDLATIDLDTRIILERSRQPNFSFPLGGATYQGDWRDPNDVFGYEFKQLFPGARVINAPVDVEVYGHYLCFLIWPKSQTDKYLRADITDISDLPLEVTPEQPTSHKQITRLNEFSDIRELLGCYGYERKFTVTAGSPGWEDISVTKSQIQTISNRNEGRLDATQNDFNTLFDVLQGLTLDDILPGVTCAGLVRTKNALFSLIEYAMAPDPDIGLISNIANEPGFTGSILTNCKITNIVVDGTAFFSGFGPEGSVSMSKEGGLKAHGAFVSNVTLSGFGSEDGLNVNRAFVSNAKISPVRRRQTERLIGSNFGRSRNRSLPLPYALIYYAGHGTRDGDLMIEKNQSIGPDELFFASTQFKLPFMVVLDMCYSHRFGQRYKELMQEHNWPGIVFASCDGSIGKELSYESDGIWQLRRPRSSVQILTSEKEARHGTFSTAFACALLKIRQDEIEKGTHLHVSLRKFNDSLLNTVCKWLH